jgi:alkylation response protein AidB-like acyl-CoA dehydrogenase
VILTYDVLPRVDAICADVVSAHAIAVDREAAFPSAAIGALREAGLLGLISSPEVGGMGAGPKTAALVVERLARSCASTAMVTCMHYSGAAVLEKLGSESIRREVASGRHLSTLAFSEAGSRSHFWAPVSSARASGDAVLLDAQKSFVTSARSADAYVWSSRPIAADGASTLWLVPRGTPGIAIPAPFDGLGLRGNDSAAIVANNASIPAENRLGADGGGFDAMMGIVLPWFSVMNAGCSIGIMEAAVTATAAHAAATSHVHLGSKLADLPTIRASIAKMKIRTDQCRTLWLDTLDAIESARPDAMLRVLECKAAAGEGALEVTAAAMRVCGGAAYRKDVGVERQFRDAQAASVMAPTTDQLYDFIGKAVCGLPLF